VELLNEVEVFDRILKGTPPSCPSSPGDNSYFKNAKLEVPHQT
jgi:hypothetical protein